jgi:hypothetical protein
VIIDGVEATEDALLAEYAAAQEHVGVINTVQWQSAAIVLGGALAGAGLLATLNVTDWQDALVVMVACGGLVLVILLWFLIWRRHAAAQRAIQNRMRDIERPLGLRRNIYIDILRQRNWAQVPQYWQDLTDSEREKLGSGGDYRTLPWPPGQLAVGLVALVVIALLIFLAVGRLLDALL